MSWTDIFPVMSDELVEEFESIATPEEKAELEEWYGVKEVFNAQDKPHLVSFSVYRRPDLLSAEGDPPPTSETPLPYIQSVLEVVPALLSKFDDVAVRIYLAADLESLIADFVTAGCEVHLMRHSSLGYAPGDAWRLLAFEEKGKLVTMIRADGIRDVGMDLKRTRTMQKAGLNCWREPFGIDYDPLGRVIYNPFLGSHMGLVGGWPVEKLLHAFTWHSIRKSFSTEVALPGCGPRPISRGY